MNKARDILEFEKVLKALSECAASEEAKKQLLDLKMIINEKQLEIKMKETTEARRLIDSLGMPPLSSMKGISQMIKEVEIGTMLKPDDLTTIASLIKSVRQMKRYLARGEYLGCELAFYGRGFYDLEELEEEIERSIRNGEIESEASSTLRTLRRNIEIKRESMKVKLEKVIQAKKNYLADSYIMSRNGHYVIAVKREYKHQIEGQCLDTSRTGSTVFIEPAAIGRMHEELTAMEIEESNEERRILYMLTGDVEAFLGEIKANMEMMLALDTAFAKGKLSADMKASDVKIVTENHVIIKQGRHPLLSADKCVPLDFEIGGETKGIIITGPNTGGKTVALKTIGLLSMMVQCGLHVPVQKGSQFTMYNQILCDIGDGQSIEESLSTFSSHIKSITEILECVTEESLVLLDELGSGTDPKEGMGIAIAILEALRQKAGLFVATTHYPEVKDYALSTPQLQNACMQFDKETLKPLYTLKIGQSGESCALYIAEKLGFPKQLVELARVCMGEENHTEEGYIGENGIEKSSQKKINLNGDNEALSTDSAKARKIAELATEALKEKDLSHAEVPKLTRKKKKQQEEKLQKYNVGDSVLILPNKEKGIVFKASDEEGKVGVQVKGKKIWINHKRLKLLVAAAELYPEDYDFAIIFDSVANRKAKHQIEKGYRPEWTASYESEEAAKWGE